MTVRAFDQKIEDFIKNLGMIPGTKVGRMLNLLEQFGSGLTMPYSRNLGDKLFELRIRGQQEIRIFYTFYENKAFSMASLKKHRKYH